VRRLLTSGIILFFLFLSTGFSFQNSEGTKRQLKPVPERIKKGFDSILPGESGSFLEFLAADELEGRDTASVGMTIARKYIKSLYKLWGVKPAGDKNGNTWDFDQNIAMVEIKFGPETRIEVKTGSMSSTFEFQKDFSGGTGAQNPGVIDASVVFAGYGISAPDLGYDDFAGIDVKDKIVVISVGKPGGLREDSPFNFPENLARFAGRRTPAENCARVLAKKGAAALLMVDESSGQVRNAGNYIQGSRIRSERRMIVASKLADVDPMVPFFWISSAAAKNIFADSGTTFEALKTDIDTRIKPHSINIEGVKVKIKLDIRRTNTVSANILASIEGSDPELKHEYIVIGAHLDHVGMNKEGYVFNGADDNASGSVGVLQVAKAFALNPVKPKRSILFAHWTGEEKGLLGSTHFVFFPTVPLKNLVACINLDMICTDTSLENLARDIDEFKITREELSQFEDDPDTLLAAFTSSPSPTLVDYYTQLSKDYLHLQPVPMSSYPMIGNSDHYPFAQRKIPAVFLFTMGNGFAHSPADTFEKANLDKMSRVVKLAYLLAFKIGDAKERIEWK